MISDGEILLGYRCKVARTFKDRAVGLIGHEIEQDEGLFFPNCSAIHTFFMSYPIDVVFFDKNMKEVKRVNGVKPWTFCVFGGLKAKHCLETKTAGVIE